MGIQLQPGKNFETATVDEIGNCQEARWCFFIYYTDPSDYDKYDPREIKRFRGNSIESQKAFAEFVETFQKDNPKIYISRTERLLIWIPKEQADKIGRGAHDYNNS